MVRNGVQTISIFLQQHCTSCIFTCIVSITNASQSQAVSVQAGCIVVRAAWQTLRLGWYPQFYGRLGLAKSVSGAAISA